MILIHKTFCEITPESAENGDFSDSGYHWENEPVTFKELIEIIECHKNSSCYPVEPSVYTWFSNDFEIECYETMTERQDSIHYSDDNSSRNVKYWVKAIRYVFNIKG